MKRVIPFLALVLTLIATASFGFKTSKRLVDEVIRMSQAGVNDDAIVEYVVHTAGRFVVTADDVIAMKNAGVSSRVIRVMVDESARRDVPQRASAGRPHEEEPMPPYLNFYDPWWFLPRYYTNLPRTR